MVDFIFYTRTQLVYIFRFPTPGLNSYISRLYSGSQDSISILIFFLFRYWDSVSMQRSKRRSFWLGRRLTRWHKKKNKTFSFTAVNITKYDNNFIKLIYNILYHNPKLAYQLEFHILNQPLEFSELNVNVCKFKFTDMTVFGLLPLCHHVQTCIICYFIMISVHYKYTKSYKKIFVR